MGACGQFGGQWKQIWTQIKQMQSHVMSATDLKISKNRKHSDFPMPGVNLILGCNHPPALPNEEPVPVLHAQDKRRKLHISLA